MKKLISFICLLLVMFVFTSFNNVTCISVNRINYLNDNDEEVRKMYIEVMEGSIKNKYTKDNPLYLTVGEEITYHMSFSSEEYPEQKLLAESAIYSNYEGTLPSNILTRTMNDTFWDEFGGIRFAFRATNSGDCRVVIKNKTNNEIYDTIFIKVVNANLTQFKDPLTGNVLNNPNSVNVDVGTELEFFAVLSGDLTMNGNVPSTENFVGSGFWSWDVPVTNEWVQLENHKWLTTYRITTQGPGQFTVGLGRNGNGALSSTVVNVVHNKIEVNNISMGTISYAHINKNIATKMLNGFNRGDNNQNNRYPVNIGEDITVNASVGEGYSFSLSNDSTMSVKTESSFSNGVVSATFNGISAGNNEILLKNENGDVVETFYIQVRYPFYVDTFMGEVYKDNIHEYLDVALHDFYTSHVDGVVSNPSGVPQYVKNGWDYYMYYYLFGENSVTIVSYANAEDTIDFSFEGNLDMKNHNVETITSGPKAGLKRISGEFSVTVPESGGLIRMGNETFIIAQKSANERVHHFDLETTDGGKFTKNETTNYSDGYTVVEETIYSTKISGMHGAKIYSADGTILVDIPQNQYWLTYPDSSTQFESTSAYITNEAGNLIDSRGNIIDDLFRAGIVQPQVTTRNILLGDIDKVDFDVDVDLIPVSKTRKVYKRVDDEEMEFISSEDVSVNSINVETLRDYILSMTHTQIIDAYNKCPFHSGLDFTVKVIMHKESNSDKTIDGRDILINPQTGNVAVISIIIIGLVMITFTYIKRKKIKEI